MYGEEVISGVINGFFARHQIEKWTRLLLSLAVSAFCTFFATLGSAGLAHLSAGQRPAFAFACATCEASIAMAALVFFRWTHDPLTKKIPISVPSSLEQAERKILEKEGITTQEPS